MGPALMACITSSIPKYEMRRQRKPLTHGCGVPCTKAPIGQVLLSRKDILLRKKARTRNFQPARVHRIKSRCQGKEVNPLCQGRRIQLLKRNPERSLPVYQSIRPSRTNRSSTHSSSPGIPTCSSNASERTSPAQVDRRQGSPFWLVLIRLSGSTLLH